MTEPTKTQIEQARACYAKFLLDNTTGTGPADVPHFDDNAYGVRIALAAIIETQKACAAVADKEAEIEKRRRYELNEAQIARDEAGFIGSVSDCIRCLSQELNEAIKARPS